MGRRYMAGEGGRYGVPLCSGHMGASVEAISPLVAERSRRLHCLDAFRGLTVAAMLVVNNPGTWEHVYAPLRHAPWHGCTPTDLIFPFFLFIVGVSIAFSKRLGTSGGAGLEFEEGPARVQLRSGLVRIGKRAATLVLVGLGLNLLSVILRGDTNLAAWRFPGVLQRIGLCYGIVATAHLLSPAPQPRLGRRRFPLLVEAGAVLGVLVAYAWILRHVGAPGSGADPLSMEGNIVAWVDRLILGAGHMYRAGTHDPEGLLSTLPAIGTTLIGLWVGRWLRGRSMDSRSAVAAALMGISLAACGLAWTWLPVIGVPLNKELWTSSYVLFTAGCAMIGLGTCILVWDVWGSRADWRPVRTLLHPAETMGRNAMVAFVGSGLAARALGAIRIATPAHDGQTVTLGRWIYERVFTRPEHPELGSLLYALAFLGVWWGVLVVLERKKWYWKV